MESAKLATVIERAAALAGRTDTHVIVSVLKSAGKATAAATAKNLSNLLKDCPAEETAASSFLADLAVIMQLAAARGAHKDLMAVSDAARHFGDHSADDLIALINKPKSRAKKTAAKSDPAKLRRISDQLFAAGHSKAAFDSVLVEAEKLKKPELVEIANTYLGYKVSYKTKADAIKAIRSRHQQDALEDSRNAGMKALAG